jgi:hypothetical protein
MAGTQPRTHPLHHSISNVKQVFRHFMTYGHLQTSHCLSVHLSILWCTFSWRYLSVSLRAIGLMAIKSGFDSRQGQGTTRYIRKVKIRSPENICKAFFYSLVALLQHTFIYFST